VVYEGCASVRSRWAVVGTWGIGHRRDPVPLDPSCGLHAAV